MLQDAIIMLQDAILGEHRNNIIGCDIWGSIEIILYPL